MSAYTTEYLFSGNAKPTTLAGDVTGGVSTTITLTDATGWPSPTAGQLSIATLKYDTSSEVKITYSGRSGTDLTGVVWDYDGTTASGTYTASTTIRHSISAEVLNDHDRAKRQTVGKATTAGQLLYVSAANVFTALGIGTARQRLRVNSGATAPEWVDDVCEIGVACSDETTAITTGTAKITFRMPYAMTVTAVRASLATASTSGAVTVDINDSGTTILSTKLTLDQDEKTSTTAATPPVISDTALADDAEITVDIDGAGTGAKGLKVWIIGKRAS